MFHCYDRPAAIVNPLWHPVKNLHHNNNRNYAEQGLCNGRESVRPSDVRPIIRPQRRRAAGLLLSAVRAGDIDRQQRRRSTALSSKCGECHVDRRG